MNSKNWIERIIEERYKKIDKDISKFIKDSFKVLDKLSKEVNKLKSKYSSLTELINSKEFQALIYNSKVQFNLLGNKEQKFIKEVITRNVNGVTDEVSHELGFNFYMKNENLERILNQDWVGDGSNYSFRIWKNKQQLITGLNTVVSKGIREGWTVSHMVEELSKIISDVPRYRLYALVRTETMHFMNEATRLTYKQDGVKKFKVMCAPDERTCPHCLDMDGTVHDIDSPDLPPYHVRCRCTIVPYFEE